jgi:hypothetical protein
VDWREAELKVLTDPTEGSCSKPPGSAW